ncbi:MAG: HAMP domain-containing histidine kinase [bacterium]|nr:HAMP domain-containing histidine kinase [bacterium]
MRSRMGFIYGVLVALICALGIWWIYYLTVEGRLYVEHSLQKMANDRLHAAFLVRTDAEVRADPERWLGPSFPHLVFRRTPHGIETEIDPRIVAEIEDEGRRRRNMFLYEGGFFLLLLMSGSTILAVSWRNAERFKQARELFLAGATHEFKTPLASLRLYTETLAREGLPDEARGRIHKRMVTDVVRLENLVDDMLAMSADDTFAVGPRERLDLYRESQTVLDGLRPLAMDHGSRFDLVGEPGAAIMGQRLYLALALRNLLVNAVRHSPAPVHVTVTIESGRRHHRVVVADNGPGIPRKLQERVFECFYSTTGNQRHGGTGLGLYLVRRNIESVGGKVTLQSEEGRGCTFTLTLPAAPATA